MAKPQRQKHLDEAFDRIEETILPGVSMVLDALIVAAGRGHRGLDTAANLQAVALQLEMLISQVQSIDVRTLAPTLAPVGAQLISPVPAGGAGTA